MKEKEEKECKCCNSDEKGCEHQNCDCEPCDCESCDCGQCDCEQSCQCEEQSCQSDEVEQQQVAQEDQKECEECQEAQEQEQSQAEQYLALAKQVQADFENFRRHALEDIKEARVAGQRSVIEVFLPCLDTFKEAKKSITDQVILDGVNMIEEKITNALRSLGVERIETVGKTYNPHLHECIAVVKDESQENDIILNEFQAGYTFNDKVIRYSKVIVNKRED